MEDPLGTCLVDDHSFNRWLCCFTFLASDDDGDLAMAAVMSLALFWAAGIWIVAALKKLGIPFNVVYKWYTLRIYIYEYIEALIPIGLNQPLDGFGDFFLLLHPPEMRKSTGNMF